MNIIIIDDEPKIRNGMEKFLGVQKGHNVTAFESAPAALEYLYNHETDVIITDIQMPDMTGLEMIEKLREANKDVSIIILSGYSRFDYAQKAIELGVRKYLTKPTDINALLKTLDKIQHEQEAKREEIREALGDTGVAGTKTECNNLLILRAMQYIDAHYSEKLSMTSVAKELYISPNYFSDLFSRTTGVKFTEYLMNVRLEKSKELLVNIKYKISDVAEAVGFSDSHYYSNNFKKAYGMTPLEYRNDPRRRG